MKKFIAKITQYTEESIKSEGIISKKRTKQFKKKVVRQNNPNIVLMINLRYRKLIKTPNTHWIILQLQNLKTSKLQFAHFGQELKLSLIHI